MSMPYIWQFEASHGKFVNFAAPDSAVAEDAYQSYCSVSHVPSRLYIKLRRMSHRGCTSSRYIINFKKMHQTNLLSQRKRKLRRIPLELKVENVCDHNAVSSWSAKEEQCNESWDLVISLGREPAASKGISNFTSKPMLRRSRTPRTPRTPRLSSTGNYSIVSNDGSIYSEDIAAPPPGSLLRSESAFTHAISEFNKEMTTDLTAFQSIQQIIDNLWLQELNMQVSAELFNVVIDSAASIVQGMNFVDVMPEALGEFDRVKDVALRSLRDRSANRSGVSLEGGFEYVDRTVRENYAESLQSVTNLLSQLVNFQQACKVKSYAKKQLKHLREEMESINHIKEANTWTMLDIDQSIEQVQEAEWYFIKAVLRIARANQQNVTMQARAMRTLSTVVEDYAKNQRRGIPCQEYHGECEDFGSFVLETMLTLGQAHPSILIDGFSAVGWYASYSSDMSEVEAGLNCIMSAMQLHMSNPRVQDKGLAALVQIADARAGNKMLMAKSGVIDNVLKALQSHATDSQLQERGNQLVGSLVLAASVYKACSLG